MKTGVIIQARTGSTRLNSKVLKKLSDKSMIEHVVERCCQTKLPVVVATSVHNSDDILEKFLNEKKIPCFRGSLENVLERFVRCAEYYGFDNIIRVTGDNPLIDFEKMKIFKNYFLKDYVFIKGGAVGTGSEMVKTEVLQNNLKLNLEPYNGEHVTLYIRKNLEKFDFDLIEGDKRFEKLRLTVDEEDDFRLMEKIYSALYKNTPVKSDELYNFYQSNSNLFRLNSHVCQNKV
ncbi:MAG: hypothetical protein WC002_04130 [Candidatus Muiribacteriota bacterium]